MQKSNISILHLTSPTLQMESLPLNHRGLNYIFLKTYVQVLHTCECHLIGNITCADLIKMRMYWIRVDFSPMTCSSKMKNKEDMDTDAKRKNIGGCCLQSNKVKVARNHQELGKGKEAATPRVFRDSITLSVP